MNIETIIALIRIIAPAVAIMLTAVGFTIDADSVVTVAGVFASVILAIYSGWKNNNVTSAAQTAQKVLNLIKKNPEAAEQFEVE